MSKVKRKGAYEYNLGWHQNASALVVPKVAEQVLLHDAPIRETVESWADLSDFMMRTKVPRNSRLVLVDGDGVDHPLQNVTRYYVSKEGGELVKIMPPLPKDPEKWRRIGQEKGWKVWSCNRIQEATAPVDFDYYIREVEKLTLGLQ